MGFHVVVIFALNRCLDFFFQILKKQFRRSFFDGLFD